MEQHAALLVAGFEAAADRLCVAMDRGEFPPKVTSDGRLGFRHHHYSVPWSAPPLVGMQPAAETLGYWITNQLFFDIFQEAAGAQLQEAGSTLGWESEPVFCFSFNYGHDWRNRDKYPGHTDSSDEEVEEDDEEEEEETASPDAV